MKKYFYVSLALAAVLSIGQAARADQISFSFNDGSISTWGSFTVSNTPIVVDGVTGLEVTGVSGFFNDAALGITSTITGIYTPISYNTTPGSIAFSTAGNSYDDLYFPGGDSPADCPPPDPYPFSGGVFDVLGVLFNLDNGDTAELWSNGVIPPDTNPVYGAAVANSVADLDYEGDLVATPEPNTLSLLGTGVLGIAGLLAWKRQRRATFGSL
jgi:hypothetical protein